MKKNVKKLALSKENLRKLTAEQLAAAPGGAPLATYISCKIECGTHG